MRRLDDRVTDMKMMVRETSFCQLSSTSGLSIIDVLELKKVGNKSDIYVPNRIRPRFFDQVGHETMYATSGNKHFFTK